MLPRRLTNFELQTCHKNEYRFNGIIQEIIDLKINL